MADTLQENEKSEVQNDGGMDPGEAKTIILKRKDEPVFPVPMWNAVPQENIPSQKEAEPEQNITPQKEAGPEQKGS